MKPMLNCKRKSPEVVKTFDIDNYIQEENKFADYIQQGFEQAQDDEEFFEYLMNGAYLHARARNKSETVLPEMRSFMTDSGHIYTMNISFKEDRKNHTKLWFS